MKLKDKKISIWRFDSENTERYLKIHGGKLWAHYRQTSGEEYYRAMTNQYQEDAVFTINWRDDIDPRTDVILYRGRIYKINRTDDFEGYKTELRIYARYNERQGLAYFPGIEDV